MSSVTGGIGVAPASRATLATKPDEPRLAVVEDLDGAGAEEILAWAISEFSPDITVACSMQDAVVVDLATKVDPRIEVFFLQTGFHFAETLETAERMQRRYDLNLVELGPKPSGPRYDCEGVEACCGARRVTPLEDHLAAKRAWVSGIRRNDSADRARIDPVEWDGGRGVFKINPIYEWSDDDVAEYIRRNDIIVNPLRSRGFASIGCAPCTRPGDGREGRWPGSNKTECGIHVMSEGPVGDE